VAIAHQVEANIVLDFNEGTPVAHRTKDDLPRHVKGTVWWHQDNRNPELTRYYFGTQDNNYVVEFLHVRSQDHWYNLSRKRGPTGKTYHTTDSGRRIKRYNTQGIGYWKQGDKAYYPDEDNVDYDPAKEPATEQNLIHAEEQEFLSGGLHHITTIKGKNPLHKRPPILLQAIAQHAVAGGSFDTSTKPFTALEPTLSKIQECLDH